MKFDLLCYIVKYLYILLTDQDHECWRSSQETLVPEDVEPENGWYDSSTPGFIYSTIFFEGLFAKRMFFLCKKTLEFCFMTTVISVQKHVTNMVVIFPCTCIWIIISESSSIITVLDNEENLPTTFDDGYDDVTQYDDMKEKVVCLTQREDYS